jgi:hypothetical protein
MYPHFLLSPRSVSTEIPTLVSRLTGKIQLTVSECNAPVQAKQGLKLIPIALYAPALFVCTFTIDWPRGNDWCHGDATTVTRRFSFQRENRKPLG